MHTDASGQGLGAVLEQEQSDGKPHPIAYASRTKAESRYGIMELEALGVVWALRHFRAYIYGSRTVVFTDHVPLRAMLMAKHPSGKLARWAAVIAELDVDIQYRPGRHNANADALSRAPVGEAEETSVSQPVLQVTNESSGNTSIPSAEMVELQQGDPQLRQVRDYLQSGVLPAVEKTARRLVLEREQFTMVDDILYYHQRGHHQRLRMAVPHSIRQQLMEEVHAGPFGGHFAGKGLFHTLAQHYW